MFLKNLKQQNRLAFNFAVAGFIALLFVVTGLGFLAYGLMEQKHIAKQIEDLQKVGQQLSHFSVNTRLIQGNQTTFAGFEKIVKNFNQQWSNFKQQYDYYPVENIKYADEIWENINDDTKIILASKNDVIKLHTTYEELLVGINKLNEKNNQLIHILLEKNMDDRYISLAKEAAVSIVNTENYLKKHYPDGFLNDFDNIFTFDNIPDTLLHGSDVFRVAKTEDKKIREFLQSYRDLHFEVLNLSIKTHNDYGEVYVIDAPQLLISPQIALFNESLSEINYKEINKILIAITFFGVICALACYYGYIKSLKIIKTTKKYNISLNWLSLFALSFALAQTSLFYYQFFLKNR